MHGQASVPAATVLPSHPGSAAIAPGLCRHRTRALLPRARSSPRSNYDVGVVFFEDVPPYVGPWTVTRVPIGVFGHRAWAVASCISTHPLL